MSKLPKISGLKAVKAFHKAGWILARQKGSHMIMTNEESLIAYPSRFMMKLTGGTLRSRISLASLTVDEFVAFLLVNLIVCQISG